MRITILCSDPAHPVNTHLEKWIDKNKWEHDIKLIRSKKELEDGDILFLISCSEIITKDDRKKHKANLVLHAGDLPKDRGWSPHIWNIISGQQYITLSLFEADDGVDSGRIWEKYRFHIPRHALWDEINERLFDAELFLMDFAVKNFTTVTPREQNKNIRPNYLSKRKPSDSKIDPNKSIAEQFDLIRVCDPNRFPAYFELNGYKYKLKLEKSHV